MKNLFTILALTLSINPAHAIFGLFEDDARVEEGITFASDVPEEQVNTIIQDLQYFKGLNLFLSAELNQEFQSVLRVGNSESLNTDLRDWLRTRVQFIVGENFKLEDNISLIKENHRYAVEENPEIILPKNQPDGGSEKKTIMSNIGSAVYFAGKQSNAILGVKIPGADEVEVRSPRVGILQVGPGLFDSRKVSKNLPETSQVMHMNRLSTLFHEARHSDGRGNSLGFFHIPCPEGHEYEGYAACDKIQNGPYAVGALIYRMFLESCENGQIQCTTGEKTALELLAKDSDNRVMKTRKSDLTVESIDEKINLAKKIVEACKLLPSTNKVCKQVPALEENIKNLENARPYVGQPIPTGMGDDNPEGA